jgi:hypothetical protein
MSIFDQHRHRCVSTSCEKATHGLLTALQIPHTHARPTAPMSSAGQSPPPLPLPGPPRAEARPPPPPTPTWRPGATATPSLGCTDGVPLAALCPDRAACGRASTSARPLTVRLRSERLTGPPAVPRKRRNPRAATSDMAVHTACCAYCRSRTSAADKRIGAGQGLASGREPSSTPWPPAELGENLKRLEQPQAVCP